MERTRKLTLGDALMFILVLVKLSKEFKNSKVTNNIASHELSCDYVNLDLGFTLLSVNSAQEYVK